MEGVLSKVLAILFAAVMAVAGYCVGREKGYDEGFAVAKQVFVGGIIYTTKTMTVTAYCSCEKCCGRFADGITANGHVIRSGDKFIAAPPEYPFGTVMEIPGYGKYEVKDRGGAIKGNKIDLYFDTHQEALNWGRQEVEVKIYGRT